MNRVVARLLKHLYPCGWKERYGAEFEAFLEDEHGFWPASTSAFRRCLLCLCLRAVACPNNSSPLPSEFPVEISLSPIRRTWAASSLIPRAPDRESDWGAGLRFHAPEESPASIPLFVPAAFMSQDSRRYSSEVSRPDDSGGM